MKIKEAGGVWLVASGALDAEIGPLKPAPAYPIIRVPRFRNSAYAGGFASLQSLDED